MPTEKPRITITIPEEQLEQIKEFQFSRKMKNQTQAILYLIELGFAALESQNGQVESRKESLHPERGAVISALDDLPAEFWPVIVDLAKAIVANLEDTKPNLRPMRQKNTAAARSGDRLEVVEMDAEEEEALLPPQYSGDI